MTPREALNFRLDELEKRYPVISRAIIADLMLAGATLVLDTPSQKILIDLRTIANGRLLVEANS